MLKKSFNIAAGALLFGLVACSELVHISEITDEDGVVFKEESSSSVISPVFSSSSNAFDVCGFADVADMWYGPDWYEQVYTGLENDTETGGYWFSIENTPDSESSRVVWPVSLGNDYWEESVSPVIELCEGVCAVTNFESAGFAGVGFHVVGETSNVDKTPAVGDASEWGGLCVTYASESDMDVVIANVNGDRISQVPDMPKATLPRSLDVTTKCFAWSEFVSAPGNTVDQTNLTSVFFVTYGDSGTRSGFDIRGLGRYKRIPNLGCTEPDPYLLNIEYYKDKVNSSSSTRPSSNASGNVMSSGSAEGNYGYIDDTCSFSAVDNLWYGPDGVYQVQTGMAKWTETNGYWFGVEDEGRSRVVWPVAMDNEYSDDALDSIHDFCAGVCAELSFDNNSFAGVGFNIAGNYIYEDPMTMVAGDASAWGGLCVTYASESDMDVVMYNSQKMNVDRIPYMPKVTLPGSPNVTTKCVEWSQFVALSGYTGDPSRFTALFFMTYGERGTRSRFNIVGLGRYQQISNPECSIRENFVSGN